MWIVDKKAYREGKTDEIHRFPTESAGLRVSGNLCCSGLPKQTDQPDSVGCSRDSRIDSCCDPVFEQCLRRFIGNSGDVPDSGGRPAPRSAASDPFFCCRRICRSRGRNRISGYWNTSECTEDLDPLYVIFGIGIFFRNCPDDPEESLQKNKAALYDDHSCRMGFAVDSAFDLMEDHQWT